MAYNLEYLNSNSLRSYPLKEDTTKVYGDQVIPNNLLVDAMFTVAADTVLDQDFKIYLYSITKTDTTITLCFKDNQTPAVIIGTVTIVIATHTTYDIYYISQIHNTYDDSVLKVVIGDLDNLALPTGEFIFNAELSDHAIRPALRGVRSIQVQDNLTLSDKMYGRIKIIAGTNIKLTPNQSNNSITISAIDGIGTIEPCECEEVYPEYGCIKTINGIYPDDTGNITITGLECLDVEAIGTAKLNIIDTCSVPCCGCDELTKIAASLNTVNSNINSLSSNLDKLMSKQQSFYDTVLTSTRDVLY